MIKSYPVPNTIEDIVEFMILAASNIDLSAFAFSIPGYGNQSASEKNAARKKALAWTSKMEQMYQKANMSFSGSPMFSKVKELHDEKKTEVKKAKIKGYLLNPVSIFLIILFIVSFI